MTHPGYSLGISYTSDAGIEELRIDTGLPPPRWLIMEAGSSGAINPRPLLGVRKTIFTCREVNEYVR